MVWCGGVFDLSISTTDCVWSMTQKIKNIGEEPSGLFSNKMADQGAKQTGAASVTQAGGDTAGAVEPHLVRECNGEEREVQVRDCGSTFDPLFICCLFPRQVKWIIMRILPNCPVTHFEVKMMSKS